MDGLAVKSLSTTMTQEPEGILNINTRSNFFPVFVVTSSTISSQMRDQQRLSFSCSPLRDFVVCCSLLEESLTRWSVDLPIYRHKWSMQYQSRASRDCKSSQDVFPRHHWHVLHELNEGQPLVVQVQWYSTVLEGIPLETLMAGSWLLQSQQVSG